MFIGGGVYAASDVVTINKDNFNAVLNDACGAGAPAAYTGRKWFRNADEVLNNPTTEFPSSPILGCKDNAQNVEETRAVDLMGGKTRGEVSDNILPNAPLYFVDTPEGDYGGNTGMPLVNQALDSDLCKCPVYVPAGSTLESGGPAASCEKRADGLNLEKNADGSYKAKADGYAVIDSNKLLAFKTGKYPSVGWTTTAAGTQPAVSGGSDSATQKALIEALNGLSGAQAQAVAQGTAYNLSPTAMTGFPLVVASLQASACENCTKAGKINSEAFKATLPSNRSWVPCKIKGSDNCSCQEADTTYVSPGSKENDILADLDGLEMNDTDTAPAICFIKRTFGNLSEAPAEGVVTQDAAIVLIKETNLDTCKDCLSGPSKSDEPSSAALVSLPIAALLAMPLMW